MDQKLWGKKCNFGNFGAIFDPFDPPGLKNQNFPGVKGSRLMCILMLLNSLESFRKI